MRSYRVLIPFLVLVLASLACSFNLGLPGLRTTFGDGDGARREVVTEEIAIPIPEEQPVRLEIGFAAGELNIEPGAHEGLVEGTARYDQERLAPESRSVDGQVTLATGDIDNLNDFDFDFNFDFDENPFLSGFEDIENRWDLALASVPMELEIAGGAYQGRVELGGLSLTDLTVSSGASDLVVSFSEPNGVEMGLLQVNSGASSTELTGLANARFERMEFSGGAGEFTLDFSGQMERPAEVSLDAALSNLTLVIPKGLSTRIEVHGAMANVDVPSGFSRRGNAYIQEGSGPTLTINVEFGAGNLQVESP